MTASLPAPLTLVVGDEELLVSRAVSDVVRAATDADPAADVRDLVGSEVDPRDLLDLLSPSLFGEARVVVLRGVADLPDDVVDALVDYASSPTEAVSLVAVQGAPGKGGRSARGARGGAAARLVEAWTAAGARRVECPKLTRPGERLDFVRAEWRAAGRSSTEGAVRALVEAVGGDLRELAGAAAQLASDTIGTLDEAAVARYHRGIADASGFTIADKAVEGDASGAIELLRWGLADGLAPVLVTSSLASALRLLGRVASAGRGSSTGGLARELGQPPWRIEKAQRQARSWRPDALAAALAAVAGADEDVKGRAADVGYALEKVVLRVAAEARSGAR